MEFDTDGIATVVGVFDNYSLQMKRHLETQKLDKADGASSDESSDEIESDEESSQKKKSKKRSNSASDADPRVSIADYSTQEKSQLSFAKDTILTNSGEVIRIGAFLPDETRTLPKFK